MSSEKEAASRNDWAEGKKSPKPIWNQPSKAWFHVVRNEEEPRVGGIYPAMSKDEAISKLEPYKPQYIKEKADIKIELFFEGQMIESWSNQ